MSRAKPKRCRIPGCPKPAHVHGRGCGLGMCSGHYRRHLRGSPATGPVRSYVWSGKYARRAASPRSPEKGP